MQAKTDRKMQELSGNPETKQRNKLTVSYVLLMFLNVPDCVCLFDGFIRANFKLVKTPVW